MKITTKILSLPPFISTSWANIASLHVELPSTLIVNLHSGAKIEVPGLESQIIEKIFAFHSKYLEQEQGSLASLFSNTSQKNPTTQTQTVEEQSFPMKIGIEGIDDMGSVLQHNPEQAGSPDLPPDILTKIAAISKVVGIEDPSLLPKPEPHCNCVHCQIARAVQTGVSPRVSEHEKEDSEEVTDEDLRFRVWDIKQTSDQLYSVTNPLDSDEQYFVFLGQPVGCNCGQKNCEHIRAVLNS